MTMNTFIGIKNLIVLTTHNVLSSNHVTINKPSKYNLNNLIKDKKISLKKKIDLLSQTRNQMFWPVLTDQNAKHLNNRSEFGIDVEKHVLEFDPSGITEGCGCTVCQINHKIYLLKQKNQKVVLLRQALSYINKLIYNSTSIKEIISLINTGEGFFSIEPNWLKSYAYTASLRYAYDDNLFLEKGKRFKKSFASWYSENIFDKLKEIETKTAEDLKIWGESLKDLCKLCNVPIKEKVSTLDEKKTEYFQAISFIKNLPINSSKRKRQLLSLDIITQLIPLSIHLNIKGFKYTKLIAHIKSLQKAIKKIEANNLTGEYDGYLHSLKVRLQNVKKDIIRKLDNYYSLKILQ